MSGNLLSHEEKYVPLLFWVKTFFSKPCPPAPLDIFLWFDPLVPSSNEKTHNKTGRRCYSSGTSFGTIMGPQLPYFAFSLLPTSQASMSGRKRHSLGGRDVRMVLDVLVSVTTDGTKKEKAAITLCTLCGYLQQMMFSKLLYVNPSWWALIECWVTGMVMIFPLPQLNECDFDWQIKCWVAATRVHFSTTF